MGDSAPDVQEINPSGIGSKDAYAITLRNQGTVSSQVGVQNVGGSVYHHNIHYHDQTAPKWTLNGLSLIDKRRLLLESLSFDHIEARQATIKPAHAQTCRWLLTRSEYCEWLDDERLPEHHGFLWIKGKPATGKSTIMKFAFTTTKRLQIDSTVIAFFFNARGDDLEKSTSGMYRSLIYQLLQQQPDLQSVFDHVPVARNSTGDPDWKYNSLVNLFDSVVQQLDQRRVICFIDALDECEEEQVRMMVQDLEHLGRIANNCGARFRVCFSSRHFPSITVPHSIPLILENQREHAYDIAQYLDTELRIGSSDTAVRIRQELLSRASGIFLWVVLVTRILNKEYDHGAGNLVEKLKNIPNDLETLFNDMLTREGPPGQALITCLQLALFAIKPLKLEQFYFAIRLMAEDNTVVSWNKAEDSPERIERYLLNCSKGLVEQTRGKKPTIQFIHESVRDHFLTGQGLQNLGLGSFNTFKAQSHDRLKECCLKYYTLAHVAGFPGIDGDLPDAWAKSIHQLRDRALASFPFLIYAVENVLVHSDNANKLGINQEDFLNDFDLKLWVPLHNFVERLKAHHLPPDVDLLYVLASTSLANLILLRPIKGPYGTIVSGRYGCPLRAAVAKRDIATLEALLSPIPVRTQRSFITQWSGTINTFKSLLSLHRDESPSSLTASWSGSLSDADIHQVALTLLDEYTGLRRWEMIEAAAGRGDALVLRCLIDSSCEEILDSLVALPEAARIGSVEMVRNLMERAGTTNITTDVYVQMLGLACSYGRLELLRMLLDVKIRPESVTDAEAYAGVTGSTADRNQYTEIRRLLRWLVHKDGTPFFPRAICKAVKHNHIAIIRLLLETILAVELPAIISVDVEKALEIASASDHISVVEELLHTITTNGMPIGLASKALISASSYGDEKVVKVLLQAGTNADARDQYGRSAVTVASDSGYEKTVSLLLEAGADVNATFADGANALFGSAEYGHVKVVEILLNAGINVNAQDRDGNSAILTASRGGHEVIVRMLLNAGADLNTTSGDGVNTLLAAVTTGRLEVVEVLLEAGVDINAQDHDGDSAILVAAKYGWERIVQMLLDVGVDVNKMKSLEPDGSPLIAAAANGHKVVVEMLLKAGADVDPKGIKVTALEIAASRGNYDITEVLLYAGASYTGDVNRFLGRGRTLRFVEAKDEFASLSRAGSLSRTGGGQSSSRRRWPADSL